MPRVNFKRPKFFTIHGKIKINVYALNKKVLKAVQININKNDFFLILVFRCSNIFLYRLLTLFHGEVAYRGHIPLWLSVQLSSTALPHQLKSEISVCTTVLAWFFNYNERTTTTESFSRSAFRLNCLYNCPRTSSLTLKTKRETAEAQFIVSDCGDKVDNGRRLTYRRTGPSGCISWRAGTTTLCHCRLYPPVRDYEFGYWTVGVSVLIMCYLLADNSVLVGCVHR